MTHLILILIVSIGRTGRCRAVHLREHEARRMWLIVSATAIGINLFLNSSALLIVLFTVALLYVYSARLKRTVLIGNVLIGLMTGMAFIYGGVVVGRVERAVVPAIFAFLINLARELLKDSEDIEGDRIENAVTLPIKYGVMTALMLATGTQLILIGVTIAVAISGVYHSAFLYIVIISDCLMCASIILIWLDHSSAAIRRASTLLKGSMIFGLLSIIAGSI